MSLTESIRAILARPRSECEDCDCGPCLRLKAAPFTCEHCGFVGRPIAAACHCYDQMCGGVGAGSNGAGCSHGGLVCPACDDGDIDLFPMLREIRAELAATRDQPGAGPSGDLLAVCETLCAKLASFVALHPGQADASDHAAIEAGEAALANADRER